MSKNIFLKSVLALAFISIVFACSKTTFIGSDLFVPNSINLLYKDDFEIKAKTIRRDSIITFDTNTYMSSMICGKVEDPYFGIAEAEIFIELHIQNITPPFQYLDEAVIKEVDLDSVVLVLGYDERTFYGDSTVSHDVEINLLDNELIFKDTVYSTFQPSYDPAIIGEKTFVPNYRDTVSIIEIGDTTETNYTEQLRIRIDNSFALPFIQDTGIVVSDELFTQYAPGIRIKSDPNGNSLWGIDNTKTTESPFNSILVYYTKLGEQENYRIFVDGERHNYYKHDYTGSVIEEFFGSEELGDSLLFLQGMAGSDIELDIPALADPQYDDFLVNKAELEFFVLEDEDSDIYDPLEEILLQRFDSEGGIIVTEDVFLAFEALNDDSFGGKLQEVQIDGLTLKKYTATMSVHALRMFNDDNPNTKIRIAPVNKRERPNRSIIFGPGHSKYPMKFKLTYSK